MTFLTNEERKKHKTNQIVLKAKRRKKTDTDN